MTVKIQWLCFGVNENGTKGMGATFAVMLGADVVSSLANLRHWAWLERLRNWYLLYP